MRFDSGIAALMWALLFTPAEQASDAVVIGDQTCTSSEHLKATILHTDVPEDASVSLIQKSVHLEVQAPATSKALQAKGASESPVSSTVATRMKATTTTDEALRLSAKSSPQTLVSGLNASLPAMALQPHGVDSQDPAMNGKLRAGIDEASYHSRYDASQASIVTGIALQAQGPKVEGLEVPAHANAQKNPPQVGHAGAQPKALVATEADRATRHSAALEAHGAKQTLESIAQSHVHKSSQLGTPTSSGGMPRDMHFGLLVAMLLLCMLFFFAGMFVIHKSVKLPRNLRVQYR